MDTCKLMYLSIYPTELFWRLFEGTILEQYSWLEGSKQHLSDGRLYFYRIPGEKYTLLLPNLPYACEGSTWET